MAPLCKGSSREAGKGLSPLQPFRLAFGKPPPLAQGRQKLSWLPCVKGAPAKRVRDCLLYNPSASPTASHLPLHRGGFFVCKPSLCKGGCRRSRREDCLFSYYNLSALPSASHLLLGEALFPEAFLSHQQGAAYTVVKEHNRSQKQNYFAHIQSSGFARGNITCCN